MSNQWHALGKMILKMFVEIVSWYIFNWTKVYERIENPKIDPYKYVQLIFDKSMKAIQWRKNGLFNNDAGAIEHS